MITKTAQEEFERKHPCPDGGHNVYAVRWLKGLEELLLAMQVYPTSDCDKELGLYGGYLVSATDGTILRRYSERQLKSIWPAGCPSDIYPTGLWGSDDLKRAQGVLNARKPKKAPQLQRALRCEIEAQYLSVNGRHRLRGGRPRHRRDGRPRLQGLPDGAVIDGDLCHGLIRVYR